ncbi:MAG: DUF87 domain-containing protein [Acidimicrobiia bacterium]|nr:DUF87 domain-containing protein [Acidimicrobiia bacterium]
MVEVPSGHLFIGDRIDAATHERANEPLLLEAADLTTHGVIVGMTGSGKTGLSVIVLEEALLQGIPTIILDPKGDMGNLLLTFPELAAGDFRPWINEADAEREGISADEHATAIAELWRRGLGEWGIEPGRIATLREEATFTIYTPGSTAGVPLNIIGDLAAPPTGTDDETRNDEIEGFVSSLLGLIGVDADPLSSREHILLSNLIDHAWSAGSDLDLASLVAQVQQPPLRKLGVLELDSFFPAADRTELALKLNGLIASPSFAGWVQGEPLDVAAMLDTAQGPRASIISLAHLSDEERLFVVTLVLSKLITWMRSQPGTPELRALVYMDEVFGFVPPTANPPSKKPILTILKQARAFGVGLVLATQNPVDVDYKAISNAGTWMIGRLQTERDKARLLEGMTSAAGDVDVGQVDDTISGLDKREFVLQSTREAGPSAFTTRWAMSYLAGPLTRDQIATLMADHPSTDAGTPPAAGSGSAGPAEPHLRSAGGSRSEATDPAPQQEAAPLADDESAVAPEVAEGTPVRVVDPAAPWAAELGASASGRRLEPAVVARVNLLFDETKGDIRHQQEYEAVWFPLSDDLRGDAAQAVDYDDRDLSGTAPERAAYALPAAKIHTKTYFKNAGTSLRDHLYRNEVLELLHNPELKLVSRPDEDAAAFEARCRQVAEDGADAEAAKIRQSLTDKMDRIHDAISKAEDRVRELEEDHQARKGDEKLSVIGDVANTVLGGLLGGRKSTSGILGGVRRASSKRRTTRNAEERLESAEHRLEEKADELDELEEELTDTLNEIADVWEAKAAAVEALEVGLEKNDITITDLSLVWIPIG